MLWRVTTLVLAMAFLLVSGQPAHARRFQSAPVQVRMLAFMGPGETRRPEFTWTVMYKSTKYTLNVVSLTVLSGGVTPLRIDAAVAPYQVKFQLAGEKTALQRLITAAPGQQLRIEGALRLTAAGRYLMLGTVEPIADASATPNG